MLQNKYDFIYLFDVTNGNPNGDPDAGNEPRMDAETGIGYVTDVCLKRKVRNYIDLVKNGEPGYNILIKNDKNLTRQGKEQTLKMSGRLSSLCAEIITMFEHLGL